MQQGPAEGEDEGLLGALLVSTLVTDLRLFQPALENKMPFHLIWNIKTPFHPKWNIRMLFLMILRNRPLFQIVHWNQLLFQLK